MTSDRITLTQKRVGECLLVITGAFDHVGGIAAVNRLVVHTLNEAGYPLRIIALHETRESQAKYPQFPNVSHYGSAGNKVKFAVQTWHTVLTRRLAFVFFDHVNLASILAPFRLMPYTVFLHGIEIFRPLPDFEGRIGLRGAKRRLANSEFTAEKLLEQFPQMSIKVCDLALDPSHSKRAEELLSARPVALSLMATDGSIHHLGPHVILHVGRMASGEQYKGQDTLIKAMPPILSQCPDAQLVLVGKGNDDARLLSLVHAQPSTVQGAIFMPGYVAYDLLEMFYRLCYLFAMPSRGEGFGLVYIEAMRWAKPCLGSQVDAARCIIRDGETGLLVNDPTNAQEVAEQIIWLIKQPFVAEAMGLAGLQRVRSRYLFSHFKERFLQAVNL